MRTYQIVIVDVDDVSRHGIETILQKQGPPFKVVRTFARLDQCEMFLESTHVQMLVLSDALQDEQAIVSHVEALRHQHPSLSILVVSEYLNVQYIQNLFTRGVSAFILREERFAARLVQAIEAVARGDWFLSPKASRLLYTGQMARNLTHLKRRELDVARLMYQGYTVQEIAVRLDLSDQAVYRSRRKLRECLQVQTSEQIVAAAKEKGLI